MLKLSFLDFVFWGHICRVPSAGPKSSPGKAVLRHHYLWNSTIQVQVVPFLLPSPGSPCVLFQSPNFNAKTGRHRDQRRMARD